jgi:hypothetical protein
LLMWVCRLHFAVWNTVISCCAQKTHHSRRLGVASGATAPGSALEGAPRFRPKVVLMSLSMYILW